MITVVLPAYNEEKMIAEASHTISGILAAEGISYEILFVDDGSKDGTWAEIQKAAEENSCVRGLHLSRNFGKDSAMFAGLEHAKGDCVVVLDCDLQHPPEKIVEMYGLWEQGYQVIEGVKADRGAESAAHRLAAGSFYRLISKAMGMDLSNASDFKLLDRKVVEALNQLPEKKVFFRALSYWVGFRRAEVSYEVRARAEGKSKWSTGALVRYTIRSMCSFSSLPLHVISFLGVFMLLISIVFGVIALVQKIAGTAVPGFTTVILLVLLSSSLIMISLGIIGYYVGRVFDELKGRPRYLVAEECGRK